MPPGDRWCTNCGADRVTGKDASALASVESWTIDELVTWRPTVEQACEWLRCHEPALTEPEFRKLCERFLPLLNKWMPGGSKNAAEAQAALAFLMTFAGRAYYGWVVKPEEEARKAAALRASAASVKPKLEIV